MLALFVGACATTTTADVQRMGRNGEVDQLVDTWDAARHDTIRTAIITELVPLSADPRARSIVMRSAAAHPSEPVRLAAVRGLRTLDGPDVTKTLITGLGDPWPSVRDVSRLSLEEKGAVVIEPLVSAAATHSNHLVRASSLRLLTGAALKFSAHRAQLATLMMDRAQSDDAPKAREAAVQGLGHLRLASARKVLMELVRTDADPSVRLAAERSIKKLGASDSERTIVVAVLPLKNDTGAADDELDRLGAQMRPYLAARLSAAKVCRVVDREKIDQAIQEMRKVGKAVYDGDAPNAPEIGQFKLANQLVYGSVQKQGLQYTIVLNRMDVSTLELVPGASATVTGYRADLEQLKAEVAERFLARFR